MSFRKFSIEANEYTKIDRWAKIKSKSEEIARVAQIALSLDTSTEEARLVEEIVLNLLREIRILREEQNRDSRNFSTPSGTAASIFQSLEGPPSPPLSDPSTSLVPTAITAQSGPSASSLLALTTSASSSLASSTASSADSPTPSRTASPPTPTLSSGVIHPFFSVPQSIPATTTSNLQGDLYFQAQPTSTFAPNYTSQPYDINDMGLTPRHMQDYQMFHQSISQPPASSSLSQLQSSPMFSTSLLLQQALQTAMRPSTNPHQASPPRQQFSSASPKPLPPTHPSALLNSTTTTTTSTATATPGSTVNPIPPHPPPQPPQPQKQKKRKSEKKAPP